ncbi:hypothetical protein OAT67_04415 [Bacteriovoracaceae bacterium]|nr:hypothetical protein [Bacteriovoracaceae bacterium]
MNEVFYSFDTHAQLEGLKFHPFHFFFSTLIRPFMPLHFVGILYFVKPDIYKEIDWPKAIFLFATIMLVFY